MSSFDPAGPNKTKSSSDEAAPPEQHQLPPALRRGRSVVPRRGKSIAPSGVKQPSASSDEPGSDGPPAPVLRKGASTAPRRPSAEEPSSDDAPPPVPVVRKGASTVPRRASSEEPSKDNPTPTPVIRKGASTAPRPGADEPSDNPPAVPVLRKGASTAPKQRPSAEEVSTDNPPHPVPVVRKGTSTAPRRSTSDEETPPVVRKGPSVNVRHKSSTASDYNNNAPMPVVPMPRVKMSSVPGDPVEDGTDSQSDKFTPKLRQVPSIFAKKNDKIPETYFKTVDLKITLDNKEPVRELDIQLSPTMVLRMIGKGSPFFCYLVVGDQILEINGSTPLTPDEAYRLLKKGANFKIRLIRPWNVRACGKDRKPGGIKRDSSYQIVEVHKLAGDKNGFEIKGSFGKCIIGKIDPGTRGAHAFLKNDRILDCDAQAFGTYGDLQALRKRFTATVNTSGVCSFLVERPIGLRSSPNPSLCAARVVMKSETEMGDDACEIGAREATRWKMMKDKYRPKSILKEHVDTVGATQGPSMEMDNTEEERNAKKGKQNLLKKKNNKRISIDNRNEVSKMPSDVKDVSTLQRVTAKSGIIGFVRNYLSK